MVSEKSKANLEKGKGYFAKTTKEVQREIAKKGAEVSNRKQAEKRTMRQLAEICLGAKLTKPEIEAKLKEAGLPATYGGQMLFNAIQKAGVNPQMLRTILELTGDINQTQNNVTVNAVPIIIGGEDDLK